MGTLTTVKARNAASGICLTEVKAVGNSLEVVDLELRGLVWLMVNPETICRTVRRRSKVVTIHLSAVQALALADRLVRHAKEAQGKELEDAS